MTTAPHRRHDVPSARRSNVQRPSASAPPVARRRAETAPHRSRRDPLTPLGHRWIPGRSALMPPLGWGLAILAGLALQYAHLTPTTAIITLGGVFTMLTVGMWGVTGSTITSDDDVPVKVPVYHIAARVYLTASSAVLGFWLTGITVTGRAYTAPAWIVVGAAAFIGWFAWPGTRGVQIRHERWVRDRLAGLFADEDEFPAMPPRPEPGPERHEQAEKWERTFRRAGIAAGPPRRNDDGTWDKGGLELIDRRESECGPVLHVRFPEDMSVTHETLVANIDRLAGVIAQRMADSLRPGALRVQRAKNRAGQEIITESYIYIDVRDILADIIWIPDEHRPLSIYNAFPVGKFADGTTITLNLSEIHTMIAGMTRKGKSNLLHVLIFQLTRCVDALVWMYDGKGGATAGLWAQAYLDGAIDPTTGEPLDVCCLDWIALDRFEFERMLLAAVALAKVRPGIRRRRGQADPNYEVGEKWHATQDDPAVFIIADEVAESVGQHAGPQYSSSGEGANSGELSRILTSFLMLGCGEHVHAILAGQRGTVTMFGGGEGKSQMGGRIGLPFGGAGEGSEVFQKDPKASIMLSGLTHAGSVVLQGFQLTEALPGKIWLAGERANIAKRVYQWSIKHAPMRPDLDDGSYEAICEFGYATRWTDPERLWWAHGLDQPPKTLRRYTPPPTSAAAAAPAVAAPAEGMATPFDEVFAQLEGTPAPDRETTTLSPREESAWDKIADEYGSAAAAAALEALRAGDPTKAEPDVDTGSPAYRRFLEIIDEAGAHGIKLNMIYTQLEQAGLAPKEPRTLYTWRDRGIREGKVARPATSRNAPIFSARYVVSD